MSSSVCIFVISLSTFPLSLSFSLCLSLCLHTSENQSISLFLSLTCYLKHTWHGARLCSLILQQYCIFISLHFTPFHSSSRIPSNKQQSSLAHTVACTQWQHCVCGYKCMLIALLVFSFMLPPLLSCENLSVCASISPFLSAFSALRHSSSVPHPAASRVWPTESSLSFYQTPYAAETVKRPPPVINLQPYLLLHLL